MKAVILMLFAAVAGVMAYLALRGECPDGEVFASEAECRAAAGFDAAFCRQSFVEARRKAVLDYAPFPNQNDCQLQFPRCEPHQRVVSGFVPVPRGVCVARGREGDPVYERYGQRINTR
jgi:uncharacterized protein YgiB involved in biofilm formation